MTAENTFNVTLEISFKDFNAIFFNKNRNMHYSYSYVGHKDVNGKMVGFYKVTIKTDEKTATYLKLKYG